MLGRAYRESRGGSVLPMVEERVRVVGAGGSRAPTRHYRDGDRARRAVTISSLLGGPQGHADLFHFDVPGKWQTVIASPVSAARVASSLFQTR